MLIFAILWGSPFVFYLLAFLLLFSIIFVWQGYRRAMNPLQFPIYILNYIVTRTLWGLKVRGAFPESLKKHGCIIVANHRSSVDPMALQSSVAFPIKWMIAREYCEDRMLGWLLRIIGTIPVTRGAVDRTSAKLAIEALKNGDWIGIFPEAKINTTDELLLPARTGIAMLAFRAGVPVVPCFIEDSPYKGSVFGVFLIRAKVRITIGEPIYFNEPTNEPVDEAQQESAKAETLAGSKERDNNNATNVSERRSGRHSRGDRYSQATLTIMRALAKVSPQPDFIPTVHDRGEKTEKSAEEVT